MKGFSLSSAIQPEERRKRAGVVVSNQLLFYLLIIYFPLFLYYAKEKDITDLLQQTTMLKRTASLDTCSGN